MLAAQIKFGLSAWYAALLVSSYKPHIGTYCFGISLIKLLHKLVIKTTCYKLTFFWSYHEMGMTI